MTTATRFPRCGRVLLRVPLWTALGLVSTVALAATPINERVAADAAGQVEISNVSGLVDVQAWARNEVEVTGELGKGTERLEVVRNGNVVRIKVILPSKSSRAESSELFVKLPAGSGLAINTVSADIAVRGLRGSQRLQSVSGDIRTEAAAEDVECKTVSGDVDITGSGQRTLLTVTTVSGDAALTKVAGEVNGNTVSGDFTIAMSEAHRSRLRSTSGNLGFTGRLATDARLDIESISGDVRLDLAAPIGAEFDVSSFNGDIRNCFGPEPVRTSEYAPGRELRFREGSGAARVRIKTLNGDISVCNK